MGMKVNIGKTKVMVFERSESATECDILIESEKIEQVKEFEYLDSLFTNDGKHDGDIERRVNAGNKVNGALFAIKKRKSVSLQARFAIHGEVRDPSRWYKKMYDTIHKTKLDGQPIQRVSPNKSQYAYFDPRSGYLSEPEGGLGRLGSSTWSDAYDSDVTTGPRRRTASVQEERHHDDVTSPYLPSNKYSTLASARASQEVYKNQPGRIEDYVPGKSSVVDKEAKQWLDENSPLPPYGTLLARAIQKSVRGLPYSLTRFGVACTYLPPPLNDVLTEDSKYDSQHVDLIAPAVDAKRRPHRVCQYQLSSTTSLPQASPKEKKDITSTILSKSNMARALKESGYESDSTLVFRRRDDTEPPLSPAERRAAYRDLQAGGEPPLRGFRSPAPPRQDETEIEYIPISPTLTKIRVHKRKPQEIICYPMIGEQLKFLEPPAPPRRVSSKNNRTLRLVTSGRTPSTSPKRTPEPITQTNIDFLREKINSKLSRQGTQILSRKPPVPENRASIDSTVLKHSRIMSTSAPPAIDRKKSTTNIGKTNIKLTTADTKSQSTSSFSSPRRTLLPTEYTNPIHSKFANAHDGKVIIEGGVGRRTPISNILDKVTPIDKLWNSEKRNEPHDYSKGKLKLSKSIDNMNVKHPPSLVVPKSSIRGNTKPANSGVTHRARDMIRTSDKLQKLKPTNLQAKSMSSLATKIEPKSSKLSVSPFISKAVSTTSLSTKKNIQIKTASVTNLKKKQSLESITTRPRSVPCHASCSKKSKENGKSIKKLRKQKNDKKVEEKYTNSESGSQFGDTSNEPSQFGSIENITQNKPISSKEIKEQHDAVVSDAFFQHLFLGNVNVPTDINKSQEEYTSVLQKAKLFQKLDHDLSVPKALNSYLILRKPVSESKFKLLDSYTAPESLLSPRSVSWPGRMHGQIRKFESLFTKSDEFGSSSSLATIRSRSEPPVNKMYFSQTSRPKSPIVIFHKKVVNLDTSRKSSPTRMVFSQTSRPISPKVVHKMFRPPGISREKSPSPTRFISTETVRPISPVVTKRTKTLLSSKHKEESPKQKNKIQKMFIIPEKSPSSPPTTKRPTTIKSIHSRSQSTSPVTFRSPSYRRINSTRTHGLRKTEDIGFHKKTIRTRSAGDVENIREKIKLPNKTHSDTNLQSINDPDYEEYILDMQNTKARSDRFRELNRYYNYLERVAELEKATSTCDLRHRKKDEEIIDFDRWKKIRSIERAEEELNNLYRKLKIAQTEKDVLFYPRDPDDFRWKYDNDRGLRIKEKSVEDLKDHFQQISESSVDQCTAFEIPPPKDTYKPLWRGTSVAETAFNINRKNETSEDHDLKPLLKPTITFEQDSSLNELRKKLGLGSRLWSSLSMDQVNALKSQLNAIYSKDVESKSNKDYDKYTVTVTDNKQYEKTNLHVRSSSLMSNDYSSIENKDISKSQSIAAINYSTPNVKEMKNNVNKIQMALSENEKRKISQTLSKEVMNRVKKSGSPDRNTITKAKEIMDPNLLSRTVETEYEEKRLPKKNSSEQNSENKRHVIFPVEKSSSQHHSSASETDTISSDMSSKTVIYREPKKDVLKKIEYFESVNMLSDQNKTVYHARESSDEKEPEKFQSNEKIFQTDIVPAEDVEQKNKISQSQSCTNFKELFGESEKNKFLSLPPKTGLRSRSPSPHWELQFDDRRTPDTLRYSSDEAICRSRSESPDPERHVRAYLRLARAGEVRRLARRFDSPAGAGAARGLRRHRSDPGLASPRALYRHALSPVARVPLRPGNRFMPHIDIISKLASLRRRTTPRSHSFEEALECRPGEVERIRRRFETMSLLGQIYSSAPDVSELRDIAPYLTGPWIAHRYPKRRDNNISLVDGSFVGGRTSPVRKDTGAKRPTKESIKLSSILKSEDMSVPEFNPAAHRPTRRYEPPRAPPRPPPAAWPLRLAPYIAPAAQRHTVTFKVFDCHHHPPTPRCLFSFWVTSFFCYPLLEGGRTPDPPRRAAYTSSSDTVNRGPCVRSRVPASARVHVPILRRVLIRIIKFISGAIASRLSTASRARVIAPVACVPAAYKVTESVDQPVRFFVCKHNRRDRARRSRRSRLRDPFDGRNRGKS
ncbi:hypothetical protein EVAR_44403_1 [Eumeta japonica]|uniref:SoHo domain-containing protein n=1 Tax=Eumeta variegata TaxID=151549 RepID=A0A4C1XQI3_EUMVA|nr:hypothetical protein EVAR_44403_1 [Eumeta japonica]